MDSSFLRTGRVKGTNGILFLLRHNKREYSKIKIAPNIDSGKSHLNYSLINSDSASGVSIKAKKIMEAAGIKKLRINAVVAIEMIFSLPIGNSKINTEEFFLDCLDWLKKELPIPILAFDVHLDEAARHAHAILLPLIDGRMVGSEIIGFKGKLTARINSFNNAVGKKYKLGLLDNKTKKIVTNETLSRMVLLKLKSDCAMESVVWPSIRDAVCKNALPFAQILNISLPPRKVGKSFVQIMIGKGKGPKYEKNIISH